MLAAFMANSLVREIASIPQQKENRKKATGSRSPPLPTSFPPGPSVDVSLEMLKEPLKFLEGLQRDHGDTAEVILGGGTRAVVTADPEVARRVLVEAPDVFVKSGTAFSPGSRLAGNGLLVSDGEIWRRQRKLATSSFRQAAVKKYAETVVDGGRSCSPRV